MAGAVEQARLRARRIALGICRQCKAPCETKPDGSKYRRCTKHRLVDAAWRADRLRRAREARR